MRPAAQQTTEARTEWTVCPICGGAPADLFVAFSSLAFVQCHSCQAVYKRFELSQSRPDDFYEKGYFHGRKSGRDRRFAHRVRKASRWLISALQFGEARRLLDVGCSFGYVIEAGRRLGMESAGVDISAYAVEVCRSRGYRAEVGTLEHLPFGPAEFDLVMMKHVLEHTPRPREALSEIRRVTSAGALVLIAVPDLSYWKGMRRRETYRYFRPDDLGQQHFVYYTQAALVRLLEENGFEVVASSKAVPTAVA